MKDFGIRCVIAPSFAEIFRGNCIKNMMLPVALPAAQVRELMARTCASPSTLEIDLPRQVVRDAHGAEYPFDVDAHAKHCLLNGLNEIALTLLREEAIAAYEASQAARFPWLCWSDVDDGQDAAGAASTQPASGGGSCACEGGNGDTTW